MRTRLIATLALLLIAGTLAFAALRPSSVATTTSTEVFRAQPSAAIWPFSSTQTRFSSPTGVARSFAVAYLGMSEPVVGSFSAVTPQTGLIEIRPGVNGVVTTVAVRKIASSWWVLGCTTPDIVVDAPRADARVSSPLALRGMSTAYEAVVNVAVRADQTLAPLVVTTLKGGSMGTMGAFQGSVAFNKRANRFGALVLSTVSPKDGSVQEATVVRLAFAK